ncbi:ATP-binding protein [Chryseolinea sp. H1M3-3]|uniref:ATP-binding protein n=1 Tax=Chryseolinea sp. H1M3-3 TaxID=3034144 RepID=UPI0023EBB503|nr:ATP-binding protein [Chryseolinea sp. H1M3-3]
MKEIVCVKLENEMDLILAHKRAMKLCELIGFSLITQTSVATAVSEIARCAIEHGKNAELVLCIHVANAKQFLHAIIRDKKDFTRECVEACQYAKRLVGDVEVTVSVKQAQVVLKQRLSLPRVVTEKSLDSFVKYFKLEPPLSPYDELRRKNLLLQDLAEKVQKSENDFRVLTDSLPLMMFSANNAGVVKYSNQWLVNFLGQMPDQLTSLSWKNFLHPHDYTVFAKNLNNAYAQQTSFNGQYRFREKASGKFLWHMISVVPLKDERQIITQWIGFIVDVDAQKLIEVTLKDNRELKATQEQLFENQKELQEKIIALNRSNYELEQFAHLASHDLQEPLRKLFFYSDTLNRRYSSSLGDAGHATLSNIVKAAERMKELITDLLSYSQLQNQHLLFEQVDLNMLMGEVLQDMDYRIQESKGVVEIDKLSTVMGNPLRLRQLFVNLISNSLKYRKPDVPPHIRVSLVADTENVSITVKDNGIGFEDEYKEKIFGLFERLHTRDRFPGTGIGLSICKKIAELHNASINAESILGEYAIFKITFPLTQDIQRD